jgi:hypothetical protein
MSFKECEVIEMLKEELCFCKRDVMSICTADSKSDQKNCKFFQKSSFTDRCMYLMFDEFCDCLEAQVATEQKFQEGVSMDLAA